MSKDPETDLTMASLAHMPLRGTIEAARDLAIIARQEELLQFDRLP